MAVRYPLAIILGFIIIIGCLFIKKKKEKYKTGVKLANSSFVRELPYFQKKLKEYKLFINITKVICLLSIIMASIMLARPFTTKNVSDEEYNRDIFLCMDVSASVDELNLELIENLKDTVRSLKGERFGISVFNTSSVTLVPLTDDYEYVLDVLDEMKKSLQYTMDKDLDIFSTPDYLYTASYLANGTDIGYEERGSSLIGDGLATCVYNFAKEDKNRTKIIIMSTDNSLAGDPLLTLKEAASLSKKEGVIVYGIGIEKMNEKDQADYENAVAITGGKYYAGKTSLVKNIVSDIEKTSKSLLKKKGEVKETDVPTIPFILLLLLGISLIFLNKKVIP